MSNKPEVTRNEPKAELRKKADREKKDASREDEERCQRRTLEKSQISGYKLLTAN